MRFTPRAVERIRRAISEKLISSDKSSRYVRWLLLALIVIPITAISIYGYNSTNRTLTDLTMGQRQATATLAANTLQERFAHLKDLGISLATRVQFQKLISDGKWAEAGDILKNTPHDFPFIDRVFISDPSGTVKAATGDDKTTIGKNFAYRDWYKGATKEWQPYVSDVYQRVAKPSYNIVAIATPIISDKGKHLGIVVIQVRQNTLAEWTKDIKVGSAGYIYIVDSKGHIVVHPNYPSQETIVDYSSIVAVQRALKGQSDVSVAYNPIERENKLAASAPVVGYGWGVVATEPTSTAFAERDKTLHQAILIDCLLILLTARLAYLFLKAIKIQSLSRQKEQVILQSIGDGLVSIDRGFKITLWNKVASELTGWSQTEAMGKPLQDIVRLIRESDGQPHYNFIEEVMSRGEVRSMENHTLLIRKDGSKISVSDSAAPVLDHNGIITGAIIIFRDSSDEYKIQKLKEDQKQFLENLLENIPAGVILAEAPTGKFTFMNPAAVEILGRGADPRTNTSTYSEVYDVLKKDGQPYPSEETPLAITLIKGIPAYKDDILIRKPDGNTIFVRARSTPIKDGKGKVTSAIVIFEDITEAKQLEQSKDEFFSIASHELRTPLTAIRGDASMMLDFYADNLKEPALRQMVVDIHTSSIRLIELVNDFLDSSRLEQGQVEFKIADFDIVPVINEVMKELEMVVKEKNLELKLVPPASDLPKIKADPNRLEQILFNLVGNGLKFTDAGSVTVELEVDGDNLKVRVKDTGSGIPADKQNLLFQKFQQAGRTTLASEVTKGSGLGLYISKMMAEGMGGSLVLERSGVKQGSTFTVTLPLAK